MFVNKIKGLLLISVIEQVTTGINNKKHLKARKDFFIFIKFELAFVEQTSQKRSSLVWVAIYMRIEKKKMNTVIQAIVRPEFRYCKLVNMMKRKHFNNKTNLFNEQVLEITCNNNASSF